MPRKSGKFGKPGKTTFPTVPTRKFDLGLTIGILSGQVTEGKHGELVFNKPDTSAADEAKREKALEARKRALKARKGALDVQLGFYKQWVLHLSDPKEAPPPCDSWCPAKAGGHCHKCMDGQSYSMGVVVARMQQLGKERRSVRAALKKVRARRAGKK